CEIVLDATAGAAEEGVIYVRIGNQVDFEPHKSTVRILDFSCGPGVRPVKQVKIVSFFSGLRTRLLSRCGRDRNIYPPRPANRGGRIGANSPVSGGVSALEPLAAEPGVGPFMELAQRGRATQRHGRPRFAA